MLAASIDALVVPSLGEQGQSVAMSAQASSTLSNPTLTYTWYFGDGASQSGVDLTDVTHAYTAPSPSGNPYVVTLSVNDGDQPASATSNIEIDDVPPTVNAGPSQVVYAGSTVQFNGSVTDAGGPSQIASIQWDFNYDGSNFNPDTSANGNLTPTYQYSAPGTYTVAMQATDQSGAVSQDFTTVTVKPTDALLVNAGPDVTVTAGQPVTLSGSYTDPGGTVSSSGIVWDTNYDGQNFNPTVSGTLTPSVTYSTPGTYQAALQITDSTGASDVSVVNVTVQPVSYTGPTANAGSDQTINEGDTASFNGSYTDPDGTVSPSGIAWDFNYDGSNFNPTVTGTLTPTYQYTTPGDYTVALQITDSNGMTSLSTLDVTVNAVPPTVNAGNNLTVTAGQLVQFNGSASVPNGANDPLTYAWDFNYDGSNFNPGSANTLNPYYVFTAAGTYTVALQATDSYGVSSLSTLTVTVNPSNSLIVNAGPDQAVNEGDTATFSASYSDGSGSVDPSTAQWDFNFDGSNFVADPSASGTLTPSYQFTTPGTYLVAVQLTDSNNVTSIGTLYVSVAGVPPTVAAGSDQTVNQGQTVQFNGTASVPSGVNTELTYAWDFDYDGQNFVADPNTPSTLTPTYDFTTPGTYEVALQATDGYGQSSISTCTVTVNDVPPTATVTNSGAAPAGSPVTFTVANEQDLTPGDTPSILADWTGTGQFEEITSDEITTNPDGSLSFTHTYETPSGSGGYNAVIELMDGNGGTTDYTQNVVITDPAATVTFAPAAQGSNANVIDSTTPFIFTVNDPSLTETQNGFTYYVSLDGGAYASSTSPVYQLPGNISMGQHTLSAYVVDSLGQATTPMTWTGTVQAPQVVFNNNGSGQVELNWTGGGPVYLNGGQNYTINGTAAGLSVILLTSNADYGLQTNGSIDSITCATGVTGVNLTVDTGANDTSFAMWVGDGHVGNVTLPGGSNVSILARGDLWNLDGPTNNGTMTGLTASDVVFANLDGSILGVDSINYLLASGWLGTSEAQQVEVASGIGSLTAYGVGAVVQADVRQDAGDEAMAVDIGDGGVTGAIDGGNVGNVQISGNANVFQANYLEGNFAVAGTGNTFLALGGGAGAPPNAPAQPPSITSDGDMTVESQKDLNLQKIAVKGSLSFNVKGSVKVQGDIVAGSMPDSDAKEQSKITGNLTANNLRVTEGSVGGNKGWWFAVEGDLTLSGEFEVAEGNISFMMVDGSLQASAILLRGKNAEIQLFGTGKDLRTKIEVPQGSIQSISVGRDFLPPAGAQQGDALISVKGSLDSLTVERNLGKAGTKPFGKIVAQSIGIIKVERNLTTSIESTSGDIGKVGSDGAYVYGNVAAIDGNVDSVGGQLVAGNITAKSSGDLLTGNIGSVICINLTSQSITADTTIGTIDVRFAKQAVTTKITAQGGGLLVMGPNGRTLLGSPLKLEVNSNNKDTKTFIGSVTFTYGNAAPDARVLFLPKEALLNYMYNQIAEVGDPPTFTSNTTATVTQTAGNEPGAYLDYAKFDFNPKAKTVPGVPKPLTGVPVFVDPDTGDITDDFDLSVSKT